MPAIVTKDVREARARIKNGTRNARDAKREAHGRQRARTRKLLKAYDDTVDFRSRPVTGWDVA